MYFVSRGMYHRMVANVIHRIKGTDRTANILKSLALRIHQEELETCSFDLDDKASNTWRLEWWIVGLSISYLSMRCKG